MGPQRGASSTQITIDGARPGPVFDGVGAISGGGGNSRFLIDYPARQRSQILNYLFGPGGADLQLLKLEIGGDANSSDGSEPSIEHSRGQIDCTSGYEWWLAKQAVARNPDIKLYGLQWAAPGWVRSVWSHADANYVIKWLNCARSHRLTVSYLGGWNEHGYNIGWYEYLRSRLNATGYGSVKIVAADDRGNGGGPQTAWRVADPAAADPAFKAAIDVLGAHNTCGFPTSGYNCVSTAVARGLGLPLWESELGKLDLNAGAAPLARAINNGFIQAGVTGYLTWPLMDSIPPGLPYENRGLVTADQPESGHYSVNRIMWAIAQTTQFVKPGWRYVNGACAELGNSGSYDAYESPNRRDWSLVVENTGHYASQQVTPQTIHVRLTGGLATGTVHARATNLTSGGPSAWFVRQPDIHPVHGTFSYSIPPGYAVSFTSTTGQAHYQAPTTPPPAPMPLPYNATMDGSNEAWGLASQEGAFIYRRCLGGGAGQCIEQMAAQLPIWWTAPSGEPPDPFAIVGDANWSNYAISAKVLFTTSTGSISLIGRFQVGGDTGLFSGYVFNLDAAGNWEIVQNSDAGTPAVLAKGTVAAFKLDTWHAVSFGLIGSHLTGRVNGRHVGSATSSRWTSGLSGIGSSWNLTQFTRLTVSAG